ncbi:MAG: CRISPR-associated helicase Cas3', partial [Clostridia bacterium]
NYTKELTLMLADLLIAKTASNGEARWLPLSIHLQDTSGIIKKLVSSWLSEGAKQVITQGFTSDEDLLRLCTFLASTHDLGKGTPLFQAQCLASLSQDIAADLQTSLKQGGLFVQPLHQFVSSGKTPHALAGQMLLLEANCSKEVAAVIGAHHGKPQSVDFHVVTTNTYAANFYLDTASMPQWKAVQAEIITTALHQAGYTSLNELPLPTMPAQVLLSGLLIMADWIASNESYFPYIDISQPCNTLCSAARVNTAWKALALPSIWSANNRWMQGDLYQERFGFSPNAVQTAIATVAQEVAAPGIFVLEAPMGVGKTEAALATAEILANRMGCTGLFFALPTQATSNGIFPRILDWAQRESDNAVLSIRLAHAMAQLNSTYHELFEGHANVSQDEDGTTGKDFSGVTVHSWFSGRKKALLADFVIGTIDQLLLAALQQKHVMLRHIGLSGKVVIIDECHAYDAYMNQYLKRALRWLGAYHVPVIVLSATLPALRRQRIVEAYLGAKHDTAPADGWQTSRAYPLLVYSDGAKVCSLPIVQNDVSHTVSICPLADKDIGEVLAQQLSEGGCAGVIVNTVKRAQELAQALRIQFGSDCVLLYHARFLMPDRAKLEERLLDALGKPCKDRLRPEKLIVVGTQVMEQSLDIDLDLLITDLCPMDLLLQRIGRLHRHFRKRKAKLATAQCYVLGMNEASFERGASAIYGDYLLMRTKALLPAQITLPQDISPLVQAVYDPDTALPIPPAGYHDAKDAWDLRIAKKESAAKAFRLKEPVLSSKYGRTINALLDSPLNVSDQRGEAAVRDSDPSMDVLLMQEKENGTYCFLPWQEGGRSVSADTVPCKKDARAIASQRVRLPPALCANPKTLTDVISALEATNRTKFPAWQQSAWLKGELVLILDTAQSATICGHTIHYDFDLGLLLEAPPMG